MPVFITRKVVAPLAPPAPKYIMGRLPSITGRLPSIMGRLPSITGGRHL